LLVIGTTQAVERPNIIYFLADDLGWTDVGWHGSEIKTPHLDKLAMEGARLEQFYVLPVCSPTRAAFMTGRYPIRHGLQLSVVRPWAQYGLPLEERTLPQALKETGYRTAICGKWHLGHFRPDYLPTHRGFDMQYGHYNGALDYFTHDRDGGHDWHRNDQENREVGYTTTLLGDEAVRIVEQLDPKTPLFLYVPFNAPHSPLQVTEAYREQYAQISDKKRQAYAAMVHCLDEQVGRVVEAIEKRGLTSNTLFLFSSDNGGPLDQGATNGKLRAGKATLYEGGTRVVACANWQGKIQPGTIVNEPMHIVDWYPTLLKLVGVSTDQTQNKASTKKKKKAAAKTDNQGDNQGVELFNLAEDPYEKSNVASQHPNKVAELKARLDKYAREAIPPKAEEAQANFKAPKVWGER